MNRIVAVLLLAVLGLANPVSACDAQAGSTFCAEGWIGRPTERARDADRQGTAWSEDGTGMDPTFAGGDGVYVEGAVPVEGPAADDDQPS